MSKNNLQKCWILGGYFQVLKNTMLFGWYTLVLIANYRYHSIFHFSLIPSVTTSTLIAYIRSWNLGWLYTGDQVKTWPGWTSSELITGLSQTPSMWGRRENRETKDVMFLPYSITPSYWSRTSACLPGLSCWALERYCWLLKDFPLLSSGYWLVPDT